MTLFLIRHAETNANAARIVQTPDMPLSERGVAQSERLAQRLSNEGVALILSSDYERAAHTARSIALSTRAPLEYEADLRERNYGDLRGRAYAEIDVDIFAPDYAPPHGETWSEFLVRVARAWGRIRERLTRLDGALAVVTHGLVCSALVEQHLRLERAPSAIARGFGNASLTIVESVQPFTVRLLNCCAHVADGESGRGGMVV
jgi:2,3-bisphosphoglycerate-dependent phosphoglycerate mutase